MTINAAIAELEIQKFIYQCTSPFKWSEAMELALQALKEKAVSEKLTLDEIETISIHMNAFKENLCNQHRWKEAEEYQNIVDKLVLMKADREEENNDQL